MAPQASDADSDGAQSDMLFIGDHCALGACMQLDFLPFVCNGCKKTYCLDHRGARSHDCAHAGTDVTVIVCPLCAATCRVRPGEDVNAAFARHASSSTLCTPAAYQSRTTKPRCGAPSCSEKLVFSNCVTCKRCGRKTCLKHRFPDDHACASQPAASASGTAGAAAVARLAQGAQALRLGGAKAAQKRQAEVCPTCGFTCDDVALLVAHCEQAHAAADSSARGGPQARPPMMRSGGIAREVCPHCGARFTDVIALVEHHRHSHEAGARPPAGDGGAAACHVC